MTCIQFLWFLSSMPSMITLFLYSSESISTRARPWAVISRFLSRGIKQRQAPVQKMEHNLPHRSSEVRLTRAIDIPVRAPCSPTGLFLADVLTGLREKSGERRHFRGICLLGAPEGAGDGSPLHVT